MTLQEQFDYTINQIVNSDFAQNYIVKLYAVIPEEHKCFRFFYKTEKEVPMNERINFEKNIDDLIGLGKNDDLFPPCCICDSLDPEFTTWCMEKVVNTIWTKN